MQKLIYKTYDSNKTVCTQWDRHYYMLHYIIQSIYMLSSGANIYIYFLMFISEYANII